MSRLLLAAAVLVAGVLASTSAAAGATPVWLCKPGRAGNPCATGLTTTTFTPAGQRTGARHVEAARRPKVDCFYVYPTVSDQATPQASLTVDPELRSIAHYQASRFSRDCRVFAPVYRQVTLQGLLAPQTVTEAMREQGYQDVRAAWRTYLRRHNHGRGVVLLSHSQGTFVLRRLVREEIDGNRAVRRRLVSALLIGGNVTVAEGRDTGGDFRRIRACRSPRQLGCVVAYSAYGQAPTADARFGRATEAGREVLCTNPAALRGGSAPITPTYPTAPFAPGTIGSLVAASGTLPAASTPWVAFPHGLRAECRSGAGANVLLVSGSGTIPLVPLPDPSWGIHLQDVNVALGELSDLVHRQVRAYERRRG